MDPVEYSFLLYLCDALVAAPNKSEILLKIANKSAKKMKMSIYIKDMLSRLKKSKNIQETARNIRLEMF
jgi:hypothetical protein